MKKQILGLLAVLLAFTVHAGYVIVVSPDAIPAERNAALELQKHLGMLGKDFNIPIVAEPVAGKRSIFVGKQVRETLKPDEIILSPRHVVCCLYLPGRISGIPVLDSQ